ncbi:uncharacterized protein MYCGRDRAFT_98031 [Zymoseptoria tritici IPO323]|uniref:Uncharacterized protein n=1 Tax=Zymoseptoria tritici (strain CBS 115943 / IPO323) TaxID=336722 RepID=F9XS42_ZYMTI|nr:uncharacterized protein MYCGRDRAFT_98031 [Zymoseptoria tritici IPO323]EGP81944.1 hypothetical protein MYCGRDRAFT_98031 [Zymoseptoria tritici IPO323]
MAPPRRSLSSKRLKTTRPPPDRPLNRQIAAAKRRYRHNFATSEELEARGTCIASIGSWKAEGTKPAVGGRQPGTDVLERQRSGYEEDDWPSQMPRPLSLTPGTNVHENTAARTCGEPLQGLDMLKEVLKQKLGDAGLDDMVEDAFMLRLRRRHGMLRTNRSSILRKAQVDSMRANCRLFIARNSHCPDLPWTLLEVQPDIILRPHKPPQLLPPALPHLDITALLLGPIPVDDGNELHHTYSNFNLAARSNFGQLRQRC